MSKRSKRPWTDEEILRHQIAFGNRPRPDLWSDEELVDMLFERLGDFSVRGISVRAGEDLEQVFVELVLSRSPLSRKERMAYRRTTM